MSTELIDLGEIAYARSGDRGSSLTIAVIAYTAEGYLFLEENLSTQVFKRHFRHLGYKKIDRYTLSNLGALNFVLHGVLEGGSRSLRNDSQGKALGQALLEMRFRIDKEVAQQCRPREQGEIQ